MPRSPRPRVRRLRRAASLPSWRRRALARGDALGDAAVAGGADARSGLFAAQTELIARRPRRGAPRSRERARGAYAAASREPIAAADAGGRPRRAARRCDDAERRGARRRRPRARRRARRARAAVLRGSRRGHARGRPTAATRARARRWLLLRDFRTATRFTRPGADATLAVERPRRSGKIAPKAARTAVAKDLLDAYQARLRELLDDADAAAERGLRDAAGRGGRAGGRLLADPRASATSRTAAQAAAARSTTAFAALADARAARRRDRLRAPARARRRPRALDGFTAAPFTAAGGGAPRPAAAALPRARPGRVRPRRQGHEGHARLRDPGGRRVPHRRRGRVRRPAARSWPGATRRARRRSRDDLERLRALVGHRGRAHERRRPRPATCRRVDGPRRGRPRRRRSRRRGRSATDESDYDLIALTLDRMEAAVGAGQYQQAEQARLEAYAFFEFGPERRLKAFDPGLAIDVEGLIWFGARDQQGLAELIAKRAPRRAGARDAPRARRGAGRRRGDARRRREQGDGRHQLRDHRVPRGPRGGAHPRRDHRVVRRRDAPPAAAGASSARCSASSRRCSRGCSPRRCSVARRSTARSSRRWSASIAIAVLLLVMNWFFHRVYWSEWIGRFHRQRKRLRARCRQHAGFFSAQVLGLAAARAHQRLPRGLRDRPVPAVARAAARARRRCSRAPRSACADARRSPSSPSCSSASCPTRGCWSPRACCSASSSW